MAVLAAATMVFSGYVVFRTPPPVDASSPSAEPGPPASSSIASSPLEVAAIGDSYTTGQAASASWVDLLNAQGDYAVTDLGVGGSGYAHTFNPSDTTFGQRVREAAASDPDVILFVGSRNDSVEQPATVETAASRAYALAKRLSPQAKIVAVGPMWSAEPPNAGARDATAAVRSAAERAGVPFTDGLMWLQGRPALIAADGVHPNDQGQDLIGKRISGVLSAISAD